ncbi:head-to-tail stopper [Microbacterium Phage DirtyBubble]|uniref:head-to-tail stopper n=1 Tax=Microbacterium Phage DirtyBubble TaxID=2590932 RepID=UPI0011881CA1|nr:head-to-tail stopper [Microbacterium Phage DirtyBubble]QDP45027.1 head-to-tail stopper [Microbacterium Phage DirtyBubble]
MLPSFMSRALTRRRYPLVSDHGSAVRDWAATPDVADFYGSVQPGTGTEDVVNRNGREIVKTVWAQPDSDVHHDDVVPLPEGDFLVNGEPERWDTGVLDHMVIHLSRWEG